MTAYDWQVEQDDAVLYARRRERELRERFWDRVRNLHAAGERTTPTTRLITWEPFFDALKEAGLPFEPSTTWRVEIEAQVGEPCRITFHTFGPDSLVSIAASVHEAHGPREALVR